MYDTKHAKLNLLGYKLVMFVNVDVVNCRCFLPSNQPTNQPFDAPIHSFRSTVPLSKSMSARNLTCAEKDVRRIPTLFRLIYFFHVKSITTL